MAIDADSGALSPRFPSQETKTRHNRKDTRAQGSFDLTPVHRHITSKALQEGFTCTGVIWRDSGARTCYSEPHTRHKDVHRSEVKGLRCTVPTIPHDSPAKRLKQDTTGKIHVHGGHLTGLRYTDISPQRPSKRDSRARG